MQQSASDFRPVPGRFTGWHMFMIMAAFFAVILAVNLLMAGFAIKSWSGLVVKNSYVASQNFNAMLAEAEAQKRRGWTSRLAISGKTLSFHVKTQEGRPVRGFAFTARFARPVHGRDDQLRAMRETAPGVYQAPVPASPGRWHISLRGQNDSGQTYRQDFAVILKQGS